jgi:hypothetical protein
MSDSTAIQLCLKKLEKAQSALQRLEHAKNLKETEAAWSDLLMAAASIYSKLEQASKLTGKTTAWYGRVKHERKTDTLLSYIHHARNADEHGLEDITKVASRQAVLRFHEPFDPDKLEGVQLHIGTDSTGAPDIRVSDGAPISVEHYKQPTVILVEVKDHRYNDSFEPPSTHLGKQLDDTLPLAIGRLAVIYLVGLIDDARRNGI